MGKTLYNSVKVRLSPNFADRYEWHYYSLDRLDIINFRLTPKFKIYSRYLKFRLMYLFAKEGIQREVILVNFYI